MSVQSVGEFFFFEEVHVSCDTWEYPKSAKHKKSRQIPYFILYKLIVTCESTADEVSFEWSHHRISSTNTKVRTTLNVSITDSGSERVKKRGDGKYKRGKWEKREWEVEEIGKNCITFITFCNQ